MLDPKFVRENQKKVEKAIESRGFEKGLVGQWLKIDQEWRELLGEVEKIRGERNALNEELKKSKGKPPADLLEKGKKLKSNLGEKEKRLTVLEVDWKEALWKIPNLPAEDVPVGKDEEENKELRKWGEVPEFDFKPLDHMELGLRLGIIDKKRAAKVSGSRFGYYKGDGALLEMALMWYGFSKLAQKGFVPVIPPYMVKKEMERGMGYAEHGGWDQAYIFEKDDLVFISSSEHSVIPMHSGETLREKDLPIRYVNFSPCFRREAGTYGKDTRGMIRLHQFHKVEMNVYTPPNLEVSDKECLNLLSLQEEIMQELKLPYRVVNACTGDLPFPNRRMYDLEAWFPGEGLYRETHSCSNCTDFQTRRLGVRVKMKEGNKFVHALNATAISDRPLLAILENYQQKDGSIKVPEVLQKWVGKEKIS